MIYAEKGKEQECFIDFVEKALGILAQEKYRTIREGGTLYVVEDARRMLAELTQKERVEGTDYGDGTIEN